MEIDPITLCLGCFPPVGRGDREGVGEWKIDRGKTRRKRDGQGWGWGGVVVIVLLVLGWGLK